MEELLNEINEKLDQILQHQAKDRNPWMNPDEASTELGFPKTTSGSNRRVLAWLRKRGMLTKFRPGKPMMYDKEEIKAISQKIRDRRIFLPNRF